MQGTQRLLLPQRLPGYVLANLSLVPGLPHQVTKHRKYLFLLVLLLGGRARALPQRLHPAQVPFPGPGLLYVGLSHAWTPSSGYTSTTRRLAKRPLQPSSSCRSIHETRYVSYISEDAATCGCFVRRATALGAAL